MNSKDIEYIIYSIITLIGEIALIVASIVWAILDNDYLFKVIIIGLLFLILTEILFRTEYIYSQKTSKENKNG